MKLSFTLHEENVVQITVCELRRVIVYCSIFLNTLNTAYLIVKICDKMYYFLIKNTCLIDSFYFLFVDFIAMPQGAALYTMPKIIEKLPTPSHDRPKQTFHVEKSTP